jgi:hypothetical protein
MSGNSQMSIQQVLELVSRLERLSADSVYAHQASGIRGSLLRKLARPNINLSENAAPGISELVTDAYEILARAARQIPE